MYFGSQEGFKSFRAKMTKRRAIHVLENHYESTYLGAYGQLEEARLTSKLNLSNP